MNNATPNPVVEQFSSTANPTTPQYIKRSNDTEIDSGFIKNQESNEDEDDIFIEGDDGEIEVKFR